ncbi:MAG: hydrogenase maturation protease [Acidobacteriota bacterium]|nr:hydrogenase maturation protease [Acidobacteriota bacterium]MDW3228239.1 hydrogenase maturation protease [Acidobacteriota bacterium]
MEALDLLRQVLSQKTCLVGIGNQLRGDDGFGPYFIESLRCQDLIPGINLMTVEDVPENFAFPISKKDLDNVVFVDAVILNAPAGTVIFGPLDEFEEIGQIASTHKLSLRLTARVLEESGKKVFLLGVVPKTMEFGQKLSPEIKEIAEELITIIEQQLNDSPYQKEHISSDKAEREREKG